MKNKNTRKPFHPPSPPPPPPPLPPNKKNIMIASRIGTNAQCQYEWNSYKMKEQLVQFYYQLVRPETGLGYKYDYLEARYFLLVSTIILNNTEEMSEGFQRECLMLSYKMIAQTRDIVSGKGEYKLAYMMISVLSYMNISLYGLTALDMAKHALRTFVLPDENSNRPYGSWKDIKYFCNYCKTIGFKKNHPIMKYAIQLQTTQLHKDVLRLNSERSSISLAAKWIPREKSKKFGWLYPYFVKSYYNLKYLPTYKNNKYLKKFRLVLSKCNAHLKTPQIFQTRKEYNKIEMGKNVTSRTFVKQYKLYLRENIIQCDDSSKRKNTTHISFASYYNLSEHISMYDFVKIAAKEKSKTILTMLDNLWEKNRLLKNPYKSMGIYGLAIIDTSSSMRDYSNDPLYSAIGLAIRISELSLLKNRILLFSQAPVWADLTSCKTFTEKVKHIMNILNENKTMNLNSNFFLASKKILQGYIDSNIPPEYVKKTTWFLLSDMQVDDDTLPYSSQQTGEHNPNPNPNHNHNHNQQRFLIFDSIYDKIASKFHEAGILSNYRKPFEPSKIVFWNMMTSLGFPTKSTVENAYMISGFSPTLLNHFVKKETISTHQSSTHQPSIHQSSTHQPSTHQSSQKNKTAWDLFKDTMDHERYNYMGQLLLDSWDTYDIYKRKNSNI